MSSAQLVEMVADIVASCGYKGQADLNSIVSIHTAGAMERKQVPDGGSIYVSVITNRIYY
jgi:hypothetical protein